jgi:hypothetical protein
MLKKKKDWPNSPWSEILLPLIDDLWGQIAINNENSIKIAKRKCDSNVKTTTQLGGVVSHSRRARIR